MPRRIPTVAEIVLDSGVRTGFVGKWHVSPSREVLPQPEGDGSIARAARPASKREELLVIAPEDPKRAFMLAMRMADLGTYFRFERPSRLPERLPADLGGDQLIVSVHPVA